MVLHLHLINSKDASVVSENDIYFGPLSPMTFSQLKELVVGISGLRIQLFVHIPASNAYLIKWRFNTICVGGMFSRFQLFWQNISCCPLFTPSWVLLTQLYNKIINLSIILNWQDVPSNMVEGLCISQKNQEKISMLSMQLTWIFYELWSCSQFLWGHERKVTMWQLLFQYL